MIYVEHYKKLFCYYFFVTREVHKLFVHVQRYFLAYVLILSLMVILVCNNNCVVSHQNVSFQKYTPHTQMRHTQNNTESIIIILIVCIRKINMCLNFIVLCTQQFIFFQDDSRCMQEHIYRPTYLYTLPYATQINIKQSNKSIISGWQLEKIKMKVNIIFDVISFQLSY